MNLSPSREQKIKRIYKQSQKSAQQDLRHSPQYKVQKREQAEHQPRDDQGRFISKNRHGGPYQEIGGTQQNKQTNKFNINSVL